jgi:hypothetical protein
VIVRNVIAHGKGSSVIAGHPTNWLDNVSLENIRLFGFHCEKDLSVRERRQVCVGED